MAAARKQVLVEATSLTRRYGPVRRWTASTSRYERANAWP